MLKQKKCRSPSYIRWVKKQRSAISGLQADDPHHLIGHGQSAMGATASDLFAFPLTREEHNELHRLGWRRWEQRWDSQWKYVVKTLHMALAAEVVTHEQMEMEIDYQVINCDDRAYLKQELNLNIEVDYV